MRHWVILPIIYTDKGKVFDVDLSLNILKSFLFAEIGNGLWKCWVSRIYRCVLIVVLSYSVLIAYICKRFGTSKNEYTNKIYYS